MVPTTVPMNDPPDSHAAERVDASVLIPVLNEERFIRDTVAAMQAQRFDGSVEFLFMDGRSEDRTKGILEELSQDDGRIRVFDNPGRSSTAGLNVGLRNARGDYIVRMDAHTFYPEDYIQRGVERLRRGDVVWVAGPQVPYGTGRGSRRGALALGTWLGTGGRGAGGRGGWRWGWGPGSVPEGRRAGEPTTGRAPSASSTPACSPGSGGGPRWRSTVAGTRAGRSTRTRSWRRASCAPAGGSCRCP